jgi:hypothetical protein
MLVTLDPTNLSLIFRGEGTKKSKQKVAHKEQTSSIREEKERTQIVCYLVIYL